MVSFMFCCAVYISQYVDTSTKDTYKEGIQHQHLDSGNSRTFVCRTDTPEWLTLPLGNQHCRVELDLALLQMNYL